MSLEGEWSQRLTLKNDADLVENRNLVLRHLCEKVGWFAKLVDIEALTDENLTTAAPTIPKSKKAKSGKEQEATKPPKPKIYWVLSNAKDSFTSSTNRIFQKSDQKSLYSINISCKE